MVGADTVDGHVTLQHVHTDLTYGTKSYRLALFFEADSSGTCIPLIKVISTK